MSASRAAPFGELGLARGYAALLGVALVALGVAGFVDNPLVGDPATAPVFVTGTVHDMIHLALGFLSLYIAFALGGRSQADAVTALGVGVLVLVGLTLLSPNLFGILGPSPGYDVNLPGQVLHLAIGVMSIAVGITARREAVTVA